MTWGPVEPGHSPGRPCSEVHRLISRGMCLLPDAAHDQHGRLVCICLALLQTEADLLPTWSHACNSLMTAQNRCELDNRIPRDTDKLGNRGLVERQTPFSNLFLCGT